jgi:DNA-binding response OmpR family regulator
MEHTPEHKLIKRIEAFLTRSGMAPTEFGKLAVNDGNLIAQLKSGRELRSRTKSRVLSFIGSHSKRVPDVSCLNSNVSESATKVNGASQ